MKFRVCIPVLVPGTVAHDVHAMPSNLVYRIELAASVSMTNNQTFVPSVAPNKPALTGDVDAPTLNAWPPAHAGGAGENAFHLLLPLPGEEAPSIAVPATVLRNA